MSPELITAIAQLWPMVLIIGITILGVAYRKSITKGFSRITELKGKVGDKEVTIKTKDVKVEETVEQVTQYLTHKSDNSEVAPVDKVEDSVVIVDKQEGRAIIDIYSSLLEENESEATEIRDELIGKTNDNIEKLKIRVYYEYFKYINGYSDADKEIIEIRNNSVDKEIKEFSLDLLANCYYNSEDYLKSLEIFNELYGEATIEKYKILSLLGIANSKNKLGKKHEAEKILIECLNNFNKDNQFKIFKKLAQLYDEGNDDFKRIIFLEQALVIKPNDLETLFSLAYTASNFGFDEISSVVYNLYLKFERNNSAVLNNLAVTYQNLELFSKSNELYYSAIEKGNSLAVGNLASILISHGIFKSAEDILNKEIQNPNHDSKVISALEYLKTEREKSKTKEEEIHKVAVSHRNLIKQYSIAYIDKNVIVFQNIKVKLQSTNLEVRIDSNMDNVLTLSWPDVKADNNGNEIIHKLSLLFINRSCEATYSKPEVSDNSGPSYFDISKYEKRISFSVKTIYYKGFVDSIGETITLFSYDNNEIQQLAFTLSKRE